MYLATLDCTNSNPSLSSSPVSGSPADTMATAFAYNAVAKLFDDYGVFSSLTVIRDKIASSSV
jgi:hypothetical protein